VFQRLDGWWHLVLAVDGSSICWGPEQLPAVGARVAVVVEPARAGRQACLLLGRGPRRGQRLLPIAAATARRLHALRAATRRPQGFARDDAIFRDLQRLASRELVERRLAAAALLARDVDLHGYRADLPARKREAIRRECVELETARRWWEEYLS
jgi:hypothetical protein